MESLEQKLHSETEKWLNKIKDKRKLIMLNDNTRVDYLKNIDAYISDSHHFLAKDDLIHSFEAVIWSWAMLELGLQLNILKLAPTKNPDYHA